MLLTKYINGELEVPCRQKVVRGSDVPVLTSYAGLNPRSKHVSLSLPAQPRLPHFVLVTSVKHELSKSKRRFASF